MTGERPEPDVEAIIDLAALRRNVRALSDLVAPAATMLAVKADAYGHGMLPVARAGLESGATSLAVLEVPAGLALRAAGVTAPIFAWLHGPATDFRAGIEGGIELGVSTVWQLRAIADSRADRPAIVHLKIDSGLGRGGATVAEWPGLVDAALAAENEGTVVIRGAWSHLADASAADDAVARSVLLDGIRLAESRGATFDVVHLAASSAGIDEPDARFDLVRFGIAAYGISPFDDRSGADLGLEPVMTLVTRVVDADAVPGVARIAAGFAHGMHSPAAGLAEVALGGARHRVLAIDEESASIESTPVDGGAPVVRGAEVVVFGNGRDGSPTAEDWASWAGTIGDEIVTRVSPRVARRYV